MNVSLTPQLEALISKKVKQGLYRSASEVVREGLRLLLEREKFRQAHLIELRKDIAIGETVSCTEDKIITNITTDFSSTKSYHTG